MKMNDVKILQRQGAVKKGVSVFLTIILASSILSGCAGGEKTADSAPETSSLMTSGPVSASSQSSAELSMPSLPRESSGVASSESAATSGSVVQPTETPAVEDGVVEPEVYYSQPLPQAVTTDALNYRKGPGTDYEKIGVFPIGTPVDEMGFTPSISDWAYVGFDGNCGWVAIEYLKPEHGSDGIAKPVIYLYPTSAMDVNVKVDFEDGRFTCTYPAYNDGWNVTAQPDGRLTNKADGREYSYLYWEGEGNADYDMSQGFVVKGDDTAGFLQEKLAYMGLTPREYNEFIVYWLPHMQENPYNLITFQGSAYTDNAKLTVSPQPDSMLRVFMVYQPLKAPVSIPAQTLEPFERTGFAVVEWGGGCLDSAGWDKIVSS